MNSVRQCGECAMCCYLWEIEELPKPAYTWCKHCTKHSCSIYDSRPQTCRDFVCGWMQQPAVADYWYPKNSKMVLHVRDLSEPTLVILVDDRYPGRWREQPYYSDIKRWAVKGLNSEPRTYTIVQCGGARWLILPDHDVANPGPGVIMPRGDGKNFDYVYTVTKSNADAVLTWLQERGVV